MIRSNVFGTAVGAVVNPQEATARIVDVMLRLKDGEYQALNGSSYEDARRLANIDPERPATTTAWRCCAGTRSKRCGCSRRGKCCCGSASRTTPSSAGFRSARAHRSSSGMPQRCAIAGRFAAAGVRRHRDEQPAGVPGRQGTRARSAAEPALPAARLRTAQVPRPLRLRDDDARVAAGAVAARSARAAKRSRNGRSAALRVQPADRILLSGPDRADESGAGDRCHELSWLPCRKEAERTGDSSASARAR